MPRRGWEKAPRTAGGGDDDVGEMFLRLHPVFVTGVDQLKNAEGQFKQDSGWFAVPTTWGSFPHAHPVEFNDLFHRAEDAKAQRLFDLTIEVGLVVSPRTLRTDKVFDLVIESRLLLAADLTEERRFSADAFTVRRSYSPTDSRPPRLFPGEK